MDAISAPATEAVKASATCLGPQIDYIVHYKRNARDFANNVTDLSCKRNDIERRVTAAKRSGDTVYQDVERWLKKVGEVLGDAPHLNDKARGIDSWFKGWCCGRYSIGRKASKEIDRVTKLLDEGRNIREVSDPAPILDMELMPTEDFEAFESTILAMDSVREALEESNRSNIIGVHGMGGIGKTTLMKNISNEVKMKNTFDVVVMVTVSQNLDLKKIQDEIAEVLGLSFGAESEKARANRLFTRLKQEMKVLIILDDVWKRLDLFDVGIPYGENHRGCKVVLTTRRKDVCRSMRTQADVQLDCLSVVDSWRLFQKNAGSRVDSSSLKEIARDVAKECKGLPVALVTLGRAMRDKEPSEWKDVLQQLRESDFFDIEEMEPRVYGAIKLSYDYLRDEETKLVFLFCCLFPEDYKISMDELLRYMVGEDLLEDDNLNQARKKLNRLVNTLTSSHLLLKGDRDGLVLMHDVIRDVSKIIARKDHGFIVRAGKGLEGWPESKTLEKCKRLSLMGNDLADLPERPICPAILTLAMSGCQSLTNIPESFFEGMKSLLTLDLSNTPILSLPSSLQCLENLRSLNLDNCSQLQDASLIRNLKKLEIINLKKTSMKLSAEQFTNLKLLE